MKRRLVPHALRAVVCMALTVGSATAAPIVFKEGVSGDLSATVPLTSLLLGLGVNTVSGSTLYQGGMAWDRDLFAFVVPAGTQLRSLGYSFETQSTNIAGGQVDWSLLRGAYPYSALLDSATIQVLGPSRISPFVHAAFPLAAGTYSLGIFGAGYSCASRSATSGWSSTYTWRLDVIPVPEPSSLLLLGPAVLGLLAKARKRRPTVA